jgi:multidrug efflux pump
MPCVRPTAPRWSTRRATSTPIEAIASQYPEFDRRFMFMGGGQVSSAGVMRTTDWEERTRTTQQLQRELLPKLSALPGISAFPITPPSLGQGFRERPLNFVIVSKRQLREHGARGQAMIAEMARTPASCSPTSTCS